MSLCDMLAFLPLSYAAVMDSRHRLIPDWSVCCIGLCALWKLYISPSNWSDCLVGGIGLGFLLLIASVTMDGIGGADVKLCAALGLLLGLSEMFTVLFLALILLVAVGTLRRAKSLPFAPFLWSAFLLVKVLPEFLSGVGFYAV